MIRAAVLALGIMLTGCATTKAPMSQEDITCAHTWIEYKDAAVAFNLCVGSSKCTVTMHDIHRMTELERKVLADCPFEKKPPDTVLPDNE